jgi:hypothetical protein
MRTSLILRWAVPTIVLLTAGCDGEDDTTGSGGQGADGGAGGSAGMPAAGGQGGETSTGGSGGGGGAAECLSCAAAMTQLERGQGQGKICQDPTSTQLFLALSQCYCAEAACGGATGPCATVCDPEPDPEVSEACFDCIVDSFSGACESEAQACSTDA